MQNLNNMATLHLLIGIPGSGKTTFVKEFINKNKCVLVSTDKVRSENKGISEDKVWPTVYENIGKNLSNGNDVVFDATSITPKVRDRLKENISTYCNEYEINAYYFPTYYKICIERVNKRNQMENELFLPLEVIASYGSKVCPPTYLESFDNAYLVSNKPQLLKNVVLDGYQGYGFYFNDGVEYVEEYGGFRDIDTFEPVRDSSNFRLASVSKQFIAYGILTLVEKKLLTLETKLFDLFDDMPNYTKDITIRNMLNHTSGLLNYEDMDHTDEQICDVDVLNYIRKTDKTYFEIGSKYQYSNTAYVLLGLIIEKVSNVKLDKYMKENVFDKAGLKDTCVNYQGITEVNNRAYGNIRENDKLVKKDQYWCSATIGDGGLYSNIPDLKRWITFIRNINQYPYNLMKETHIVNGVDIEYGLGLRVKELNGNKLIYHCGSSIGTNTIIGFVEGTNIEFALLLNCNGISGEILLSNIREYFKNV